MKNKDETEFLLDIFKHMFFKPCEYIIYSKKLIFLTNRKYALKRNLSHSQNQPTKGDTHMRSAEWKQSKRHLTHSPLTCDPRDSAKAPEPVTVC